MTRVHHHPAVSRERLSDLIAALQRSSTGFDAAARTLLNPALAEYFRDAAARRTHFAAILQDLLHIHHRNSDTRQAPTGKDSVDEFPALVHAARREKELLARYESLLPVDTDAALDDILQNQLHDIRRTHTHICSLRDIHAL